MYYVYVCTTSYVGTYFTQLLSTYLDVKISAETAKETKWRPATMMALEIRVATVMRKSMDQSIKS